MGEGTPEDKSWKSRYGNGFGGDIKEWLSYFAHYPTIWGFCKNAFMNCVIFAMCLSRCMDHGKLHINDSGYYYY